MRLWDSRFNCEDGPEDDNDFNMTLLATFPNSCRWVHVSFFTHFLLSLAQQVASYNEIRNNQYDYYSFFLVDWGAE